VWSKLSCINTILECDIHSHTQIHDDSIYRARILLHGRNCSLDWQINSSASVDTLFPSEAAVGMSEYQHHPDTAFIVCSFYLVKKVAILFLMTTRQCVLVTVAMTVICGHLTGRGNISELDQRHVCCVSRHNHADIQVTYDRTNSRCYIHTTSFNNTHSTTNHSAVVFSN